MAGRDNLIPIKTKERARELGSKGGRVRSEKKKIAATIRNLKKWGMNKDVVDKVLFLLADSNLSAADTYRQIANLEKAVGDDPVVQKSIFDMKEKWHKMVHGEKIKTENVHHIINWSDMFKDAEIRPKKDSK